MADEVCHESAEMTLFDQYTMQDTLNPLERLIKHQHSDFALQRLILARDLADTAAFAGPDGIVSDNMISVLRTFAKDSEPMVREMLAKQLLAIVAELVKPISDTNHGEIEEEEEFIFREITISADMSNSKSSTSLSEESSGPTTDSDAPTPSVAKSLGDEEVAIIKKSQTHNDGTVYYHHILETMLPITVELLMDLNSETSAAALSTYCAIAAYLCPEDKETHLLQTVLALVDPAQPNSYRQVGVQLACLLAPVLGDTITSRDLFPVVEQLGQDTVFETRSAVATNLHHLAPHLIDTVGEQDLVATRLLPLFESLCHDSMWNVRKGAAEVIVPLSITLPPKHRHALIFLMRDLVTDPVRWVSVAAHECLGQFIFTLTGEIPSTLVKFFTDMAFGKNQRRKRTPVVKYESKQEENLVENEVKLSPTNDADLAEYCAFAFPAVVLRLSLIDQQQPQSWSTAFASAHTALVQNVQSKVRCCIASSLHELAGIIGSALAESDLLPHFQRLLEDNDEVRMRLLTHASAFFSRIPPASRGDLVPLLCRVPETAQTWRVRLAIASLLGELSSLVPPSRLIPEVRDLSNQLLEDSVVIVYDVALCSLVKTISALRLVLDGQDDSEEMEKHQTSDNPSFMEDHLAVLEDFKLPPFPPQPDIGHPLLTAHDMEVARQLRNELEETLHSLARDLSHVGRQKFITALKHCVDLRHKKLFETIVVHIPKLARDSISHVRLALAQVLTKFPPAYLKDARVMKALRKLRHDEDMDVLKVLSSIKEQ